MDSKTCSRLMTGHSGLDFVLTVLRQVNSPAELRTTNRRVKLKIQPATKTLKRRLKKTFPLTSSCSSKLFFNWIKYWIPLRAVLAPFPSIHSNQPKRITGVSKIISRGQGGGVTFQRTTTRRRVVQMHRQAARSLSTNSFSMKTSLAGSLVSMSETPMRRLSSILSYETSLTTDTKALLTTRRVNQTVSSTVQSPSMATMPGEKGRMV